MKRIILKICLFFLMLYMGIPHLNAQEKNVKLTLPQEYEFCVRKDTADTDMTLVSYEAVNRETGIASFEIMVSDMNVSFMPKTMEEWIDSLVEVIRNHSQAAKLQTLKDKGNKKLYLIKSGDDTGSIIILMYKTTTRFIMIETEIPPKEMLTVSLERWAEIFWNATES